MKKLLILLLFSSPIASQAQADETAAIKQVITESYIQPVYERGDLDKLKDGFHEDFLMNVYYEGKYYQSKRDEWIERLKKVHAPNMAKRNYTCRFDMIDYEGQTAVVKLTVDEDGKKKYVDYLTLYRFESGWRVITKQFSMY